MYANEHQFFLIKYLNPIYIQICKISIFTFIIIVNQYIPSVPKYDFLSLPQNFYYQEGTFTQSIYLYLYIIVLAQYNTTNYVQNKCFSLFLYSTFECRVLPVTLFAKYTYFGVNSVHKTRVFLVLFTCIEHSFFFILLLI